MCSFMTNRPSLYCIFTKHILFIHKTYGHFENVLALSLSTSNSLTTVIRRYDRTLGILYEKEPKKSNKTEISYKGILEKKCKETSLNFSENKSFIIIVIFELFNKNTKINTRRNI